MIDYHKELVSVLNTILPTYYEMTLTSNTKTPCISYMETNNYFVTEPTGTSITKAYSRITYQVKVWGNDIAIIQKYSVEVDKALTKLGFKRISSGELYDKASTMIQKILTYEALALENIN
jgi:hypothetical protein